MNKRDHDMRPTDPGYRVTLSREGLRRAYGDNALLVKASKRRETLHAWLFAIALGLLMGWSAVNFGGSVS